jgi:hypothetical protein
MQINTPRLLVPQIACASAMFRATVGYPSLPSLPSGLVHDELFFFFWVYT